MPDDTNDYQRVLKYIELTDKLIDNQPKDVIAEAARILAMNVAHYQAKYGELLSESMQLMNAQQLDDGATKLLADVFQTLAGVMALVMGVESGDGCGVH